MSKRFIATSLVVILMLATVFTFNSKADSERIKYLVDKKIVVGDESGNLMLEKEITRAELAKILVYAIGEENLADSLKSAPSLFNDMKENTWANGYANLAKTRGFIVGKPGNLFAPNDFVTYEEAIKMFVTIGLNRDLTDAEKVGGTSWATPYILKANELGYTKNLGEVNYKSNAPREKVFDILYEVLIAKENSQKFETRGLVQEILDNNQAKVLVYNSKNEKLVKASDIIKVKFPQNLNAEDYLGNMIDFNLDENNNIFNPTVAKEYETLYGKFDFGKDGLLYPENSKRGYIVEENNEKLLNDSLVSIVHNDEVYSLKKYKDEVKPELSIVTIHNSKVVFIRSFSFKDISPVFSHEDSIIYTIRDGSHNSKARQNVTKALLFNKGLLTKLDPKNIVADDILHVYKDGYAIVTKNSIVDAKFKIEKKGNIVGLNINGYFYPFSKEDGRKAIATVNYEEFETVNPEKISDTVKAMEKNNSVVLVDLFENVQLLRGNVSQKEDIAFVTGVVSDSMRLQSKQKESFEVKDSYNISLNKGDKVIKMVNFNNGDLVYTFAKDDGIQKIALLKTNEELEKEKKAVDVKDGKLAIDLNPSRGRYQTISVGGKLFELNNKSNVVLYRNGKYEFTDLKFILDNANPRRNLQAYVLTNSEFEKLNSGTKLPVINREDLIHTILFTNFESTKEIVKSKVVELKFAYNKIDNEVNGTDAYGEVVKYNVFKNAIISDLGANDIVELKLSDDNEVVDAKILIKADARLYKVNSILDNAGITEVKLERIDNKDVIQKFLSKQVVIFGELKEGSTIQMYTTDDDITVIRVIK